jgi:hypothetical protein
VSKASKRNVGTNFKLTDFIKKPRLRLEGDDLFVWAKICSEMEFVNQKLQAFGVSMLQKYGVSPQTQIDPEGYLIQPDHTQDNGSGEASGPHHASVPHMSDDQATPSPDQ